MMRTEREFRNSSLSMKSLVPRPAEFPTTTVEKLRFADTDRHGHITNSVFAVCRQNARMAWSKASEGSNSLGLAMSESWYIWTVRSITKIS